MGQGGGSGRVNLLILMNLKRLLYRVNIHKCLLSNHRFIELSCRFSNIFECIVVRHSACFHDHLNHFPLWNRDSEDDKIIEKPEHSLLPTASVLFSGQSNCSETMPIHLSYNNFYDFEFFLTLE